MTIRELELISEKIRSEKNISLVSHIKPDGDNIGSLLALYAALKKIGKSVNIVKVDEVPKHLRFLKGIEEFKELADTPNLLIALDCSDEYRFGDFRESLLKSKFIINIDHHKSNNNFGDLNYVNGKMSSTGELVFDLIKYMEIGLDSDIAVPLYTAISTDTGSFKYDSTTPNTMRKAAELLEHIDNLTEIINNLYMNRSLKGTYILNKVLNSMQVIDDIKTVIGKLSYEDLLELEAEPDDTEHIVTFLNEIDAVDVALFLKENEKDVVRVSARSKADFDVSVLCESFGGGGHTKAAGCNIDLPFDDAVDSVIKKMKELRNE